MLQMRWGTGNSEGSSLVQWQTWCWSPVNGRQSGFTCINAGAPCMTSAVYPLGQGFWQIDLPDDPAAPLGLVHHLPRTTGKVRRRARKLLAIPGPEDWEMKLVL